MNHIDPSGKRPDPKMNMKGNPPSKSDNSGLFSDPDYHAMLDESQHGQWEECQKHLTALMQKYPGNKTLEGFKKDFDLQYSILIDSKTQEKEKKKIFHFKNSKEILFFVLVLLGAAAIIWGGYLLLRNYTVSQIEARNQSQMSAMAAQVESLLDSGQPDKAEEIIAQMKQINPNDPALVQLSQKTDDLLKINNYYQDALDKISAGQYDAALTDLQTVAAKYPDYRNVQSLLDETNKKIEITTAMDNANQAYNESRWQDAINGYETVLNLDPSNTDPNLQERLLNSYLRRIIQMLQSDKTTIDDINLAETYYRRAIAMIPQSRIYMTERENLQKVSSDLLELKYTQTAYAMVADPNQTPSSVSQALSYLQKASNLDPKNTALSSELDKMTLYQAGFQYYVQMNWAAAIDSLQKLITSDEQYAGGLAEQLLYEAHVSRGNYDYSAGLYLDARKEFEAAEALVWNRNNLMDLFMVEVDLGNSLGKLQDYKDAASYFQYAVTRVNYAQRAVKNPGFVNNLAAAVQLYNDGSYQDSYNLFVSTLVDKSELFSEKEINAQQGTCLALIAAEYNSSAQAIIERNNLARQSIITADQTLVIPYMSE